MIIASGYTDKGLRRNANEDSWNFCEPSPIPRAFYAIVADGMGGHNAGDVASKLATDVTSDYINSAYKDDMEYEELKKMLIRAVEKANTVVFDESCKSRLTSGMGTTIILCFIIDKKAIVLHIGDSRLYLIRSGNIKRITKDHSLVEELVAGGTITEEEAQNHPQKNIITRALGTSRKVEVDVLEFDIKNEDTLLLCTDGLSNMISENEIKEIILNSENIIIAPQNLVNRANDNGGIDNITAVVLKYADHLQQEKGMTENE